LTSDRRATHLGPCLRMFGLPSRLVGLPGSSFPVGKTGGQALEQALAPRCSESPNPRPDAFRPLDRFAYERSDPLGPWWSWQSLPCANWPATAADRYAGPWDRRTANPRGSY
jgi:hypothetical protein